MPRPKSLRLIAPVARKPKFSFLFIGFMPAPTKVAFSVTGLVTFLIVRLPVIVALLPDAWTEVETKRAVG